MEELDFLPVGSEHRTPQQPHLYCQPLRVLRSAGWAHLRVSPPLPTESELLEGRDYTVIPSRAPKCTRFGVILVWGFPSGSAGKESTGHAGDLGSIAGLGRSSDTEGPGTASSGPLLPS